MNILLSVLLLNIGAFAFSRLTRTESSIAYLIMLMATLDIMYFGALVDMLKPATVLCFARYIVLLVVYLAKSKGATLFKDLRKYTNTHTLLNFFSVLFYMAVIKIKQPKLYYWDEIRIWGPSAKAVKLFDRLSSIGINPTAHDRDYPAGNAILNYFVSFFTKNYDEGVLLISYAILFFAIFAAASKLVEIKSKNKLLAVVSYFGFALLPFLQNSHNISLNSYNSISYAYGTSMVDFNIGIMFFAVLVVYFFDMKKLWYALPAVFLITVKKNGIFFALLAFCVIMCFELFTGKFNKVKIKRIALAVLAGLIIPVGAYFAWNIHLDHYAPVRVKSEFNLKTAVKDEVQYQQLSADDMIIKPAKTPSKLSLFLDGFKTRRYKEIMEEMKWYFSENEEIIHIKDKYLIIMLLITGILTAVFAEKKYKLRITFASVGLTAGAFVYNLIIAWQMQFYNDQMVEYPRYMLSYYYGWLFVILLMFLIFVRKKTLFKKAVIIMIFIACFNYIVEIEPARTILDAPDNIYHSYRNFEEKLEPVNANLKEGDRVLLVWMQGYDDIFYKYRYYMLPAMVNVDTLNTGINFSINFRDPQTFMGPETFFNFASVDEFNQILHKYFDYVYICEEFDYDFELSYGSLFQEQPQRDALYRVTDEEIPLQKVVAVNEK